MQLAGIEYHSRTAGPNLRTVIFTQGCPHHCDGCFNPQAQNPSGGTKKDTDEVLQHLSMVRYKRLSISGGEPFSQAYGLYTLCWHLKRKLGWHILVYTGYTWEELMEMSADEDSFIRQALENIDVLVDGPYKKELGRDISERNFVGSSNQRVINVKRSLKAGRVILWNYTLVTMKEGFLRLWTRFVQGVSPKLRNTWEIR